MEIIRKNLCNPITSITGKKIMISYNGVTSLINQIMQPFSVLRSYHYAANSRKKLFYNIKLGEWVKFQLTKLQAYRTAPWSAVYNAGI